MVTIVHSSVLLSPNLLLVMTQSRWKYLLWRKNNVDSLNPKSWIRHCTANQTWINLDHIPDIKQNWLWFSRTLPPKSLHIPISVYVVKHACYSELWEGQAPFHILIGACVVRRIFMLYPITLYEKPKLISHSKFTVYGNTAPWTELVQ